jgi:hypothetical protein
MHTLLYLEHLLACTPSPAWSFSQHETSTNAFKMCIYYPNRHLCGTQFTDIQQSCEHRIASEQLVLDARAQSCGELNPEQRQQVMDLFARCQAASVNQTVHRHPWCPMCMAWEWDDWEIADGLPPTGPHISDII